MNKTALMYAPLFGQYDAGKGYLAFPAGLEPLMTDSDYYDTHERVSDAYTLLQRSGLIHKLIPLSPTMVDESVFKLAHSDAYIERLKQVSSQGGGSVGKFAQLGAGGFEVLRLVTGGDLKALEAVMSGKVHNAFCLQHPPAAHAEYDQGLGFCIINNFNILAKTALQKYGLKRVMVVDFDNHYKYPLEQMWYDSDEVLYIETNQTGQINMALHCDSLPENIGIGRGTGYNVPIPLPSGAGDPAYVKAFAEIVVPIAKQYQPELILLVAGYASNMFDPLCRQQVTANGYYQMTKLITEVADEVCGGRLVAILEGGKGNYMSYCIGKTIEAMLGVESTIPDPIENLFNAVKLTPDEAAAIENVKRIQRSHWQL